MATYIKTIRQGNDSIAPRTKTIAVTDNNGNNLDTILAGKQDALTQGTGITITNNEISANILDSVSSTSTTDSLSANQGKILNDKITNLEGRGRFLSVWNATTGKPSDLPATIATTAYDYRTGDYFIVGTAGIKMPTGSSVAAGTTIETFPSVDGEVASSVNDTILYSGNSTWTLIHTEQPITGVSDVAYDGTNKKLTQTKGQTTTDIVTVATLKTDMELAAVASSGSYGDLTGKPTVDQTFDASSANAQSGIAIAAQLEEFDINDYVGVSASGSATDEVKYITIGGVEKKLAGGTTLPTVVNDRYLHTNASTGALEWGQVTQRVGGNSFYSSAYVTPASSMTITGYGTVNFIQGDLLTMAISSSDSTLVLRVYTGSAWELVGSVYK